MWIKNKKYVLIAIIVFLIFLVFLIIGIIFISRYIQREGEEEEMSASGTDGGSTVEFEQISASFTSTPPISDGILGTEGEDWSDAVITKTLSYTNFLTGENETHEMNVYARYDDDNLYIAITVENDDFSTDTESDRDLMWIYFDSDNDGVIEEDEDIQRFPWDLMYGDFHFTKDGTRVQDASPNGGGRWRFVSVSGDVGNFTYEFEIPLDSGDAQDLSITPGSTVGIKIEYEEMHYFEENGDWSSVGGDAWPRKGEVLDGLTYGKLTLGDD